MFRTLFNKLVILIICWVIGSPLKTTIGTYKLVFKTENGLKRPSNRTRIRSNSSS